MKELLKELKINDIGYWSDNHNYIIDFETDDQFNSVLSKLESSNLVEEDVDSSIANINVSNIVYFNDQYTLNLIADFDQNIYKLVIKGDYDE